MRKFKSYIRLFFKGVAMGGADVVPGVSGGTIAFITGIYGQLLNAIKSVDLQALQLLTQGKFADFWKYINGSFLLVLLSGIALSIVSLAKMLHFLLEEYPIQLWSFFFGLIIIAAISVSREIKRWRGAVILSGFTGIILAYFITLATPAETPETYWFILLSGALAICAMILPGISGSFILLILGKYTFILEAINARNLVVIAIFGLGCIVGLLSFARLVSWLLGRFHDIAVALLAGFMIGSLNKIWPWKEIISTRTNSKGEEVPLVSENILPGDYMAATGLQPQVTQGIIFMMLGIGIVVLLEQLASKKDRTTTSAT